MTQIRVAGILDDSIVDGEGLRTVLFTQGCSHGCEGCHNPQTWDFNSGTLWESELLTQRLLLCKHKKVTLSGGDPFFQAKACLEVAKSLKEAGFNIWAYTGFLYEEILRIKGARALLDYIDVLVDGRFVLCEKSFSTPYRGSRNQRLIDVPASLQAEKAVIYLVQENSQSFKQKGIFI